jgi:phosphate/sulfate permease
MVGMMLTRRWINGINLAPVSERGVVVPDAYRSLRKASMHMRRFRDATDESLSDEARRVLEDIEKLSMTAHDRVRFGTDTTELQQVERIFIVLQVLTACSVAFSHGSNDVANAVGPLSAAIQTITTSEVAMKAPVQTWTLALGGAGIVLGLATWGYRVIHTVGNRITELTPSRGFCAQFAAALVVLVASILPVGLPISTTHTLVGAVLGVGLARGIGALNLNTLRDIVASWIVTIPAGAGLAVVYFYVLKFAISFWM